MRSLCSFAAILFPPGCSSGFARSAAPQRPVKVVLMKNHTCKPLMVKAVKPSQSWSNQFLFWFNRRRLRSGRQNLPGCKWTKVTFAGELYEFKWHRVPADVSRCQIMSLNVRYVHLWGEQIFLQPKFAK